MLLREPPFFASRFRWIDSPDLVQRLGHPQAGRMERPSLIVVEDPTHRRAIVEHHGAGRIRFGRRRVAAAAITVDGGFRIVCLRGRSGASALCRWSTACSIFRRPRTFFRIWTLAWLSASRTGLARSRRKWLSQ